MSNDENLIINKKNISNYTTADRDFIMEHTEKNAQGFPMFWPTTNKRNAEVFISFVDAYIVDLKGTKISENKANFDILETDQFDKDAEDAAIKCEFISALLSNSRVVMGGVYYRGEFYTQKMTSKHANILTKNFMQNYFHVEDGDMLKFWFDKQENTNLMPYWPTKSYDDKKTVLFSAVNAYIIRAEEINNPAPEDRLNFNIFSDDIIDISKKNDLDKAQVLKSLLDSDRVVMGFYWEGKLIPKKISYKEKKFFEENFITKCFPVEERDYLLTSITKSPKSGLPLYWPTKDKTGRKIMISVLNSSTAPYDSSYSNFNVYEDEFFDLSQKDFKIKLEIIQRLWSKKVLVDGGLYLCGLLVDSSDYSDEIISRKDIVEKTLKVYIDDSEEFNYFRNNYTIEDRMKILALCSKYDTYYPEIDSPGIHVVPKNDKNYTEGAYELKFDRCNVVLTDGAFALKEIYSKTYATLEFDNDENVLVIIHALASKALKVRGGVFYKGVNLVRNASAKAAFLSEVAPKFLGDSAKTSLVDDVAPGFKFTEDKKSKVPYYWPTLDKHGRNILCSVVDADVHFKVGRNIIKASNNMNFDIYVGETFGLVGESGSGKTTISRAILGINKLTKGAIYFRGRLISGKQSAKEEKATKKNIQMIFQDPAASLNERANVDYIISEGLYNFKLFKSEEERIEKVTKMLRSVGLLPEHLSRYPHEFSGGQRQRIGIARALVIEPQLVLADEPISALDVSIRAQVLNLLKKLQREQDLTYLFIAHDLSIIRYISDRVAVMHQGYIVELGKSDEIYSNPIHPYTKALLTAIPQPDPRTKDTRKKIVYNKGDMDYSKCEWIEASPEHYVLATQEKFKEWYKK